MTAPSLKKFGQDDNNGAENLTNLRSRQRRYISARINTASTQYLVNQHVAQSRNDVLIQQGPLDCPFRRKSWLHLFKESFGKCIRSECVRFLRHSNSGKPARIGDCQKAFIELDAKTNPTIVR
jgi:hypothetical protein